MTVLVFFSLVEMWLYYQIIARDIFFPGISAVSKYFNEREGS